MFCSSVINGYDQSAYISELLDSPRANLVYVLFMSWKRFARATRAIFFIIRDAFSRDRSNKVAKVPRRRRRKISGAIIVP